MKHDPILITGVGKRVGLHLAQSFLNRDIPVMGIYRSDNEDVNNLGTSGAELIQCDLQDEVQFQAMIEHVSSKHGSLRAIIHNASEWMPDNPYAAAETMQRMMQIHVTVPYQLNLALSEQLQASEHRYTDIIHIGDYVSEVGSRKHIAYAASKAAQNNLTLSFASKLSPKVKVNSIAPALVLFNAGDDEAYRRKALAKSLMKREAGLEEMQHSVDYLLDSEYITGRILALDGGRHLT